ncbi:nuclear transport factor 2 family protein [Nocardia sp. NBC_00565]|uniref:nuclear transport factor 2 family protein n=1 Tax=Nocardia sp. NBC_00565 TaxID=2975993 RepID=UPI002E80E205|nr:nuclear transport factor 2 family protein [Nocardia sp. NBC_00565]WUC05784.1 nuclear transport factor 2 family protein [Nocardia sp. NBC_00565]
MTEAQVALGVHAAIATYTRALDEGRTSDIVATFCPDGATEIMGVGTFEGHNALQGVYAGMVPTQPQKHLVANTVITSWTENQATASSDLVFLQRGEAGWAVGLVGRYQDTLRLHDGAWRFQHRNLTYVV